MPDEPDHLHRCLGKPSNKEERKEERKLLNKNRV